MGSPGACILDPSKTRKLLAMTKEQAFTMVAEELNVATQQFGEFASKHEGYAIILEEMDELWEAIKSKSSSRADIEREARQVAAMAIRFLVDQCM